MKPVTIETVRERLSYLEGLNERGVGTAVSQQQFETACLRELLTLLDELEKEKGYTSAFEAEKWHYHGLAESEGERADRAEKTLEAAEMRNAELEARAVNLPKRSVGEVMHMSGFSRDYAEGWCAGNNNAIHEIRAAGIGVKGK